MKIKGKRIVYKGCKVRVNELQTKTQRMSVNLVLSGVPVSVPVDVAMPVMVERDIPVLVTLELPPGTSVTEWPSSHSDKARANRARVLRIEDARGGLYIQAYSTFSNVFVYTVGEVVKPDLYDPRTWQDCSNGIHFYRGKDAAWAWAVRR